LLAATDQQTFAAIRLGQAMAAWNCQFEGARGGMYGVGWVDWREDVLDIVERESTVRPSARESRRICPEVLIEVCSSKSGRTIRRTAHVPRQNGVQRCAALWQEGGVDFAFSIA